MRRSVQVAAMLVLVMATPACADTVVPPDRDPFYKDAKGIEQLANGTVLDSREVTVTNQSVPINATAWQVKFKTLDTTGKASAYITTVIVGSAKWTGKGPQPVLSYQTAEDGVGLKCAPSYMLTGGVMAESNTSSDANLISQALDRGWIVVVPDYEGPNSAWLGATGDARGIIDGLHAAFAFKPAKIDAKAPIALWGYSGGAVASSEAAQMQPSYAPTLNLVGVALGGNNASVKDATAAFDGSYAGGALVIGMIGLDRAYPQHNLKQFLNDAGRSAYTNSQKDCIADAVAKYPFAKPEQFLTDVKALDGPEWSAVFKAASPLTFPGTPTAPVYDYHATGDELAPIEPSRKLLARYCAAGTKVQSVETEGGEHIAEAGTGAPGAMDYIAARFAGVPAPNTCKTPPLADPAGCGGKARGPRAAIARLTWRASRRGVSLRGTAATGCNPKQPRAQPEVSRVSVAIARVTKDHRCRFLQSNGKLAAPRACTQPIAMRATGTTTWRFATTASLPAGHYRVYAWASDTTGRQEAHVRARRGYTLR